MVRRTVVCAIVAVLLVTSILSAQGAQVVMQLPANLSISVATDGKPATLRHTEPRQTFQAQARDLALTALGEVVIVRMTEGEFVWTDTTAGTQTKPYADTFKTLELKFETATGNFIAFRIID